MECDASGTSRGDVLMQNQHLVSLKEKKLIGNYESMIKRSWPTYDIEKFKQYLFKWHFIYLKLQIYQQNLKYSYTKGITKMDKTSAIKDVVTVHMPVVKCLKI